MKAIIKIFIFSLVALCIMCNCVIAATPETPGSESTGTSIQWKADFNPSAYDGTLGNSENINLGSVSPLSTAFTIVYWTSSFLGIIFLVLIIYAGFIWFMARGNEEEVTKAQTILKRAVIGLIIVLLSVSIAYLMYWLITNATVTTPNPNSYEDLPVTGNTKH